MLPFYPNFLLSLPGGGTRSLHGLKVTSGILNLLGGGEGARNGVRFLFSDTEVGTILLCGSGDFLCVGKC